MTFQIIDNLEIPTTRARPVRQRSEFTQAVDSLQVGQGFEFNAKQALKQLYVRVAPKRFDGKKFKLAVKPGCPAGDGTNEGTYLVKRVA